MEEMIDSKNKADQNTIECQGIGMLLVSVLPCYNGSNLCNFFVPLMEHTIVPTFLCKNGITGEDVLGLDWLHSTVSIREAFALSKCQWQSKDDMDDYLSHISIHAAYWEVMA